VRFNPLTETVGLTRDFAASLVPAQPDPPVPFTGTTFGVVTMVDNSPHAGEVHPDGDEILYLISGRVTVTLETIPVKVLEMKPGEGLIVPKGVWHRVDIVEASQIVYVTPGPNTEFRPLERE